MEIAIGEECEAVWDVLIAMGPWPGRCILAAIPGRSRGCWLGAGQERPTGRRYDAIVLAVVRVGRDVGARWFGVGCQLHIRQVEEAEAADDSG